MLHTGTRYAPLQPHPSASRYLRERVDERAGRMLSCSPDHAQKLRTHIIAEAIVAILVACQDDATKREDFRRRCLTALSAEDTPDPTPDLILEAATADAREDVSRQAATMGEMTEGERRAWVRDLRDEIASKTDLLRALEGLR